MFDLFDLLSGAHLARVRDPEALVRAARLHGLTGVIAAELGRRGLRLPDELHRELVKEARTIAGNALKLRMLLGRVLQTFAQEGLRPVVLKGYPLGARCYPDPLLRPSTDVDLLVREEELAASEGILTGIGLAPIREETQAYLREHHHHLVFGGPAGMVELHFRAIAGFGASIEWADLREPVDAVLDELPLRYLTPEDELTYLAAHAAEHAFARLSWLYDLRRFIGLHPGLDWERLVTLATVTGFAVPVWAALGAAKRCFKAEVPAHVLAELKPSPARASVLNGLFSEQRLHDGAFSDTRQLYAAQVLMTATVNRAVRFATHHTLRAAKRKVGFRFPGVTPRSWRA